MRDVVGSNHSPIRLATVLLTEVCFPGDVSIVLSFPSSIEIRLDLDERLPAHPQVILRRESRLLSTCYMAAANVDGK